MIFLLFQGEKSLIFRGFETKGGGESGSFAIVSKRQNMSDFYFASIPKGPPSKFMSNSSLFHKHKFNFHSEQTRRHEKPFVFPVGFSINQRAPKAPV